MNRRIIISEEEKNRILEKHNRVLKEDRKTDLSSGQYFDNQSNTNNSSSNYDTPGQNTESPTIPKLPFSPQPKLGIPPPPKLGSDEVEYKPGYEPLKSSFFDPKTGMIISQQPTETPKKTETPVKQKKVVRQGGGQQQPAKIDNYQVYGIQDILNKKFGLALSPDGKWGPKTAQAVLDKLATAQTTPQTT